MQKHSGAKQTMKGFFSVVKLSYDSNEISHCWRDEALKQMILFVRLRN